MKLKIRQLFSYFVICTLASALLMSYTIAHNNIVTKAWADPNVISNQEVKDAYIMYIKEKIKKSEDCPPGLAKKNDNFLNGNFLCNPLLGIQNGNEDTNDDVDIKNNDKKVNIIKNNDNKVKNIKIDDQKVKDSSKCHPGVGKLTKEDLQNDNVLCNPGLENMKKKLANSQLDEDIVNKLSKRIEKKEGILLDRLDKLRERMDKIISEEEDQNPIPKEEQDQVEKQDVKTTEEHQTQTGDNCRSGNVLDGASNQEDLRVISDCEEATGTVLHTKNMDDGDYKLLVELEDKSKFLLNDKNEEKADGLLVVEVVPPDRDIDSVSLAKEGDKVHMWGAWVTDTKKGWHEIHPTWILEEVK